MENLANLNALQKTIFYIKYTVYFKSDLYLFAPVFSVCSIKSLTTLLSFGIVIMNLSFERSCPYLSNKCLLFVQTYFWLKSVIVYSVC